MDADLKDKPASLRVVGVPVTALNFDHQIALMMQWAKMRESRSVCVANVHMLVEAHRDSAFAKVLEQSDLVTPDGMPLVWMLRWLGNPQQNRVAGLDIMLTLCRQAAEQGISVFLLGSEPETLKRMTTKFQQEFPKLKIAGAESLPFRPLTDTENTAIVQTVNASGAGLVLVSLGCPKQETWIAQQQGKVQAVMIGLGGAFPVYAELKKRAPRVIQEAGLEWLYRLIQEPRRLWWRYSSTIPMFVWLALKQLWGSKTDLDKDLVEIN
ncbi:MAG TPA: WecB/TagA/CpsF family glycosyltransferase [Microcoleaceae cyanobacterium]